ncbi:MAG TPA: response regulator transcription factor [Bacteroidota bacterium]|nr:response regulator transcription factor [Bacteroidota bacterium]
MKQTVLLLEDDANLGFILQEHLELNGFGVKLCTNGEDGLASWKKWKFDLCLVDVMMPGKDGFSFARDVRAAGSGIPLIFLTARAMKEDRIEGLKIGADDYVTKPFSMEELLLRIRAVLRRSGARTEREDAPSTFALGSFTFDTAQRTLARGRSVRRLTSRESDLLRLLCLAMNTTLERAPALRELWGDDSYFNSRSMDVFVSRLRRYLRVDRTVEIQSVSGKGLKLVVGRDSGGGAIRAPRNKS